VQSNAPIVEAQSMQVVRERGPLRGQFGRQRRERSIALPGREVGARGRMQFDRDEV